MSSFGLPLLLWQSYQEALRYIGKLPFEQAESNMKRYGKILMHHVPKETTELLKVLCTDYQPAGEREGPSGLEGRKVWVAAGAGHGYGGGSEAVAWPLI